MLLKMLGLDELAKMNKRQVRSGAGLQDRHTIC